MNKLLQCNHSKFVYMFIHTYEFQQYLIFTQYSYLIVPSTMNFSKFYFDEIKFYNYLPINSD